VFEVGTMRSGQRCTRANGIRKQFNTSRTKHLRKVRLGSGAAKPRPSRVRPVQCARLSVRSCDSPGSPACVGEDLRMS